MTRCIIVDLDGTVADCRHRLHHLPYNWEQFYAEIPNDVPIQPVIDLVYAVSQTDLRVVLCTGRNEDYRDLTEAQLDEFALPYDALYMRASGDDRPDNVVKKQLLDGIRADGYDPILVIDDRQKVVDMWRDEGLVCLQAASEAEPVPATGVLTLMVGPSGAGKSSWLKTASREVAVNCDNVAAHDLGIHTSHIVSTDQIRQDLTGDFRRQDRNEDVFEAVHQIVKTRIKCGLSVTVDATNIRRKDRVSLVNLVPAYVKVRYIVINRSLEQKLATAGWRADVKDKDGNPFGLIEKHENVFQSNLKDIMNGDGFANVEVIELAKVKLSDIYKFGNTEAA